MESKEKLQLTPAEEILIKQIRSLGYGEMRVLVKDNCPIRIEEIRKSIQLTNEK